METQERLFPRPSLNVHGTTQKLINVIGPQISADCEHVPSAYNVVRRQSVITGLAARHLRGNLHGTPDVFPTKTREKVRRSTESWRDHGQQIGLANDETCGRYSESAEGATRK